MVKHASDWLIGRKFETLEVIGKTPKRAYRAQEVIWLCKCNKCNKELELCTTQIKQEKICPCQKIGKWMLRRIWHGTGDLNLPYFKRVKKQARLRNLEFAITIEDMWNQFIKQNKKCALTGEELFFEKNDKNQEATASLDRIDSKKGYTKDNIQWIHKNINKSKWHYPQEYFIEMCKKVYLYNQTLNNKEST